MARNTVAWFSAVMLTALMAATAFNGYAKTSRYEAFPAAPPMIELDGKQRDQLERGKRVFFSLPSQAGDLSGVAFRVNAGEERVWAIIKSFENYPDWVTNVSAASIYSGTPASLDHIHVQFRIDHWLAGTYVYHVKHAFPWPAARWARFELDQTQENDFSKAFGFWRVEPVNGDPGTSDVYYVADLHGHDGMSAFLRKRFVKGGLESATRWVKKQAEHAR